MLNKLKTIALATAGMAFLISCENSGEYKSTDTGLQYIVLRDGEGEKPKNGQYLVVNLEVKNDKDSAIFTSEINGRPEVFQYFDSLSIKNGSVEEALGMIKKGDSTTFKILADSVYRGMMTPPGVTKGTYIFINMTVKEVLEEDKLREWQMAFMEKQRASLARKAEDQVITDKKIIADFVAEKNIQATVTESGLAYVITQAGSGSNPQSGQVVTVHYTGTLLNGEKFDSSVDRGQPFEFPLGMGQVIRGWDEGIALLNKGAKATFYIPSTLAYGARAAGPGIPANSILVFEVELIDFK